jgi:hypothetical protein
MIRSVASKVMWVGRATVFLVGLAFILALTVGVVSTALAGTGAGSRFDLGKTNTVNAISKLVGSVAGPSLLIDNNSTNAAATTLDLQVEPGKAPMKVNSSAKVANLNSDMLDGKSADAIGVNGWQRVFNTTDADSSSPKTTLVTCPGGTRPVGVGYAIDGISSSPPPGIAIDDAVVENGLQVRVTAYEVSPGTGSNWSVTGQAICATAGLSGE